MSKKLSERFTPKQKTFLQNISGWEVVLSDEGNSVLFIPRLASRWYDGSQEITDVKDFDDLCQQVADLSDSYDTSTEAYLMLDNEGHGIGAAPYYMGDVLFATEELADKLENLSDLLCDYLNSDENIEDEEAREEYEAA